MELVWGRLLMIQEDDKCFLVVPYGCHLVDMTRLRGRACGLSHIPLPLQTATAHTHYSLFLRVLCVVGTAVGVFCAPHSSPVVSVEF